MKDAIRDIVYMILAVACFVFAVVVVDGMNIRHEQKVEAERIEAERLAEEERIRERDEEWFNCAEEDYMEDPLESEHIEQAIYEMPDKRFPLADEELSLVCSIVMAEAGGESYEGKMAVAQVILNNCERSHCRPNEIQWMFAKPIPIWTEEVQQAVTAVFFEGQTVTDEKILWFYAPDLCESAWHESQRFVLAVGGHKFFAEKEAE